MAFNQLNIGQTAINAANYGLQVTGQNMANVNTTGYSRQRLSLSADAVASHRSTSTILGSGVNIQSITRVSNFYTEKQLYSATGSNSYASNLATGYALIETYFNEHSGNALSDTMNAFWDSVAELADHVETQAIKTTVVEDAIAMADRFNTLDTDLAAYRKSIDKEVKESVGVINTFIDSIAALNRNIVHAECGGAMANDLRDQRGELLRKLNEELAVDVVEEPNGSWTISHGGRQLVYFDETYPLDTKSENVNGTVVQIPVFASDDYPVRATGGALAAKVELRDEIVTGYQNQLDQLAAAFTWDFNRAYSQLRTEEALTSATALYGPLDTTLTLDKLAYGLPVVDGTFKVVNGNMRIVAVNQATGETTDINLEIDLDSRLNPDGEPDMILWDPANPDAENSFVNRLQTALDDKLPGVFKVSIDTHNRVSIETLGDGFAFHFGEDTSGIVTALGLNSFFTGHDAGTIGVSQKLQDDPTKLCTSTNGEAGDRTGLLTLSGLRGKNIDRLGGLSTDGYYLSVTGRLASESSRASDQATLKADILTRVFNNRESLSGVNEDEESLALIRYQRAYQSAAKYIGIVDELYQTLINM